MWIIDDGMIVIEDGGKIVNRFAGDLVGEIAFHRLGSLTRSASMRAHGVAHVWQIDRNIIEGMNADEKVSWLEVVTTVLAEKLVEATGQRSRMQADGAWLDNVLRRFVCEDGLMTVNSALAQSAAAAIAPQATTALLWFSDLAGFSQYAKSLDPAEAARQVRRFMEVQVEEILGAGGEVDKFMGDGLMAFWRLPDTARTKERVPRAVNAATRAAVRIKAIAAAEGLALDVRVGLHLGPVVIGDFGGMDRIAYTLVGETVNTASRYEQARHAIDGSSLGRVRISDAVFEWISGDDIVASFDPTPRLFAVKGQSFTVISSTE
jgi:class 3 adenylate cyclase